MLIKLIKNELIKMFNKKLYICLIILCLFVLTTNLLYKYMIDDNGNFYEKIDYKKEQEIYKEKIDNCINCSDEIINEYYYNIEDNRIKEKYGDNSWQVYVFENIIDYNDQEYLDRFMNDDWKSYVYEEIEKSSDERYIEVLNYRLDNNIKYGYDYLNKAIDNYLNSNEIDINKYIMDTKYNINKTNDLRGILINFFNEYGIIIIIALLIICGGILSDEYNKGTIKQLLILPCSRINLLLSKYIAIIIMFIFIFIFVLLLQIIFGSILFGISSLKIPVVLFNNGLKIYSIYKYILIIIICKIPMLILIPIVIITMNVLTNNTTVSVLSTLILYITSKILLFYTNIESIKFIKCLINVNWDLSTYFFNNPYNINLKISLCICFLYLLILAITSTIRFNKIDIKNSI